MTTNAYLRGVRDDGWTPFAGKLWQRSYHEHVIRHDDELNVVRQYIIENPVKWTDDPENEARARLQRVAAGSHAR